MTNLFKCSRCARTFIDEEYSKHLCSPELRATKTIEIDYFGIIKDEKGRTVIISKALDGTLYRLIERPHLQSDKMPFIPSNESLQGRQSDGDLTEPNADRVISPLAS